MQLARGTIGGRGPALRARGGNTTSSTTRLAAAAAPALPPSCRGRRASVGVVVSARLAAAATPALPPSCRRRGRASAVGVVASATSGSGDGNGSKPSLSSSAKDQKTQEYVEGLKKAGVDSQAAKKILETWSQAAGTTDGAADADPSALRTLFLKRSLAPILAVSAQVVIDSLAAFFAFNSGVLLDLSGEPSFGKSAAVAVATLLAGYFACGAVIDLVTLGALLFALVKLGASPDALLAAVRTIAAGSGTAGAGAGLQIADKAAAAVNAVKVAAALDAIAGLVAASSSSSSSSSDGRGNGTGAGASDTLRSLTAFLTLQRAEKSEGFDPAALGISEAQALSYALAFGALDRDEDGLLSAGELRAAVGRARSEEAGAGGEELSPEEAAAALAAMDADGDGRVTFGEFAAWFCAAQRRVGASDLAS